MGSPLCRRHLTKRGPWHDLGQRLHHVLAQGAQVPVRQGLPGTMHPHSWPIHAARGHRFAPDHDDHYPQKNRSSGHHAQNLDNFKT